MYVPIIIKAHLRLTKDNPNVEGNKYSILDTNKLCIKFHENLET